jgi:hypothetical protein
LYRREFLSKAFDIAKEEHSSFGLVNYALRWELLENNFFHVDFYLKKGNRTV